MDALVARLIELGGRQDIDRPEIILEFEDLRPHDCLNRISSWPKVTAELSIQELEALFKGMTIAELRFQWCGGSAASVIYIFRVILARSHDDAKRLYEWAVRRTTNIYVPTGSVHGDTIPHWMIPQLDLMDKDERERWYLSYRQDCIENRKRCYQEKLDRIEQAELEAERNRMAKADRRKKYEAFRNQRRQDRARLLQQSEGLRADVRLFLLLEYGDMPLDAFPDEWAAISDECLTRLGDADIDALLDRLTFQRQGAWNGLWRRLQSQRQNNEQRDR